jgi:hypothetical protein
MKRNLFIILGVVILLVAAGILLYQQTSAQDTSLREILGLDENQNSKVTLTISYIDDDPQGKNPDAVLANESQQARNREIINHAAELIAKADGYLKPGWLHTQYVRESFNSEGRTFLDGSLIPTKEIDDEWVLIGEDGLAIKAVRIDDTGDPHTTQILVFKEGLWKNLTSGGVSPSKGTYQPGFDPGIVDVSIDRWVLEEAITIFDGEDVVVFTKTLMDKVPHEDEITKATLLGTMLKFYVSIKMGLTIRSEYYAIALDGTTILTNSRVITLVENVDTPPNTILEYLGK